MSLIYPKLQRGEMQMAGRDRCKKEVIREIRPPIRANASPERPISSLAKSSLRMTDTFPHSFPRRVFADVTEICASRHCSHWKFAPRIQHLHK